MIDITGFISKPKSMLIAPAGYGKTHTIVDCLKHTEALGKQLILTHTHAGIASIKEKMKQGNIKTEHYNLETITGFAQKYVHAFFTKEIPFEPDSKEYYPFIITTCTQLFHHKHVTRVLKSSYKGLFVDEYQDCSVQQHELIAAIASVMPARILGDYLQGIFNFNGDSLVDMQDSNSMGEFSENILRLEKPYRWLNGNNVELGNDLKVVRSKLEEKKEINLSDFKSIEVNLIGESKLHEPLGNYYKSLSSLLNEPKILVIHPETANKIAREKVVSWFQNRMTLMEAIDDNDFYKLSKLADTINETNLMPIILKIIADLFTGKEKWFNETGFKKKREPQDQRAVQYIQEKLDRYSDRKLSVVAEILKDIKNLSGINVYRRELLFSICSALVDAEHQKITVYDAMLDNRNKIRRMGRKASNKCIATTLLTKGLEFDTVAILDAHKIKGEKHLYVAMTRATKRLIMFTQSMTLNPYEKEKQPKKSKASSNQLRLDL